MKYQFFINQSVSKLRLEQRMHLNLSWSNLTWTGLKLSQQTRFSYTFPSEGEAEAGIVGIKQAWPVLGACLEQRVDFLPRLYILEAIQRSKANSELWLGQPKHSIEDCKCYQPTEVSWGSDVILAWRRAAKANSLEVVKNHPNWGLVVSWCGENPSRSKTKQLDSS